MVRQILAISTSISRTVIENRLQADSLNKSQILWNPASRFARLHTCMCKTEYCTFNMWCGYSPAHQWFSVMCWAQ